mmetsp:Transcript_23390/g.37576  ORF Transcript_23390/g.37576 Transcript_23390/m.37576 type:complete len:418 (+) Transcript_23390:181-1434(+)
MLTEDAQAGLAIALALLYSILSLSSLVQVSRIIFNGHNLGSFQAIFLFLVFLWMTLRAFFFAADFDLPNIVVVLILWLPYTLQFTTFSLILVFYAKLFYQQDWPANRPVIWGLFSVANCFAFGLTLGVIAKSCSKECDPDEAEDNLFSRTIGIAYLLLTVIYSYFGVALVSHSRSRKILLPNIQGPCKLAVVTALAWTTFLTRGIYDIMKTYGFFVLNIVYSPRLEIDFPSFILYFCWEILPTFIILYYFRNIPSSRESRRWFKAVQRRMCKILSIVAQCCCCCCPFIPRMCLNNDNDDQKESKLTDTFLINSDEPNTYTIYEENAAAAAVTAGGFIHSENGTATSAQRYSIHSTSNRDEKWRHHYHRDSSSTPRDRMLTEEDDAMCKSIWDEPPAVGVSSSDPSFSFQQEQGGTYN